MERAHPVPIAFQKRLIRPHPLRTLPNESEFHTFRFADRNILKVDHNLIAAVHGADVFHYVIIGVDDDSK